MRTDNKTASVIFKFFIAVSSLIGILIQAGVFSGELHLYVFRMFTELSNAMCCVYFFAAPFIMCFDKSRSGRDSPFVFFKGICTACIALTGIVATFLLTSLINFNTPTGISMLLLHAVVPAAVVLDWLIFDKKGRITRKMSALWIGAPLAYLAFIMTSSFFMEKGAPVRYPYPFLDYEAIGIPMFIVCIIVMAIIFISFCRLFRIIDNYR